MRSLLLVLFAVGLLIVPEANAQIQFGLRAGLNMSDFAGSDAGDTDPRLGVHAGVTATYPLTPSLFVQPEVLYSQKGAGQTDAEGDFAHNVDYLDIPLLLGYALPTRSNLLVQLYAGPQVSFKLMESVRTEGVGVDLNLAKSTDFGLTFGGDVGAIRVGSRQAFGVGLRYTLGLIDIIDTTEFGGGPENVRNRVLSVSGFYRF